jgi:hypothetical protein
MRPAADGSKVGVLLDAVNDWPLFFLFILIFYNEFLDNSNSENAVKYSVNK